jgi:predicted TIM-barrel fold metal-dependent hydrolase
MSDTRPTTAPHSAGDGWPDTDAPAGAVDCHHHIFDPRFQKPDEPLVPPATVDHYRRFKQRLGIERSVFVASSNYGTDNSCLLDALLQLGSAQCRGVAMVDPGVPDDELDRLHAHGVRGLRIYLAKNRVPTPDELRTLGRRAGRRGWSIHVVGDRQREVLLDWEPVLAELQCPLVIDHLGWAPQPAGTRSATAALIRRLLAGGNAWIKLSGPYLSSAEGPPRFSDVDELAAELAALAPDHAIWGSDWPHPVAQQHGFIPDGAQLFDQLARWVPDAAQRRRVLVTNPQRLYWAD